MKTSRILMFVMVLVVIGLLFSSVASAGFVDSMKSGFGNLRGKISSSFSSLKSTASEFHIQYFLVNALILAGLLVLSIYLFGEKLSPKQKGAATIMAVVIALLVAWNYSNGFLWKLPGFWYFFKVKVLVNTAVLSVFFYLLYYFFVPEGRLKTMPVYLILIVIVFLAGMFALQPMKEIGYDEASYKANYKYIWEYENIVPWRFYLFGDSKCYDQVYNYLRTKDGEDYYFKEKEVEGNKVNVAYRYDKDLPLLGKVPYVGRWLAFDEEIEDPKQIDALQNLKTYREQKEGRYCYTQVSIDEVIAKQPLSEKPIKSEEEKENIIGYGILRGQGLFVFVLGALMFAWLFTAMNIGGDEKFRKLNYLIAIIVAGSMAHSGITKTKFVPMMELIFWYLLYKGMSKAVAEGDWKKKALPFLLSGWITNQVFTAMFPAYAWHIPGISSLGIIPLLIIGIVLTIFGGKAGAGLLARKLREMGPYIGPRVSSFFKSKWRGIASYLFSRSETLSRLGHVKRASYGDWPMVFVENRPFLMVMQHFCKRAEIFYGYWGIVKRVLNLYITQIKGGLGEHTDFELTKKELVNYRSGISKEGYKGWNRINTDVILGINETLKLLADIQQLDATSAPTVKEKIDTISLKLINDIENITSAIKTSHTEYEKRLKAYGWHNVIKRARVDMTDMCNVSSYAHHTFLFAGKGTYLNDNTTLLPNEEEVDIDGYLICDINSNDKETRKNPRRVAKFEIKNLYYQKDFYNHIQTESDDWEVFLQDLRHGWYHKYSRSQLDYSWAIKRNILKDKRIKKRFPIEPYGEAFGIDLRALEDPGRFKHEGRQVYNGIHRQSGDVCVSTTGMRDYLISLAVYDTLDVDQLKKRLKLYPADTGLEESDRVMTTVGDSLESGGQHG